MKAKDFFKEGKNNIGYVGSDFKEQFYDMDFIIPEKLELKSRKLVKSMTDEKILKQWSPKECTLEDLAYALKNDSIMIKNGYSNIFYIRDKINILRPTLVYWNYDDCEWYICAHSVEGTVGWHAGGKVISRGWGAEVRNKTKQEGELKDERMLKEHYNLYFKNRKKDSFFKITSKEVLKHLKWKKKIKELAD